MFGPLPQRHLWQDMHLCSGCVVTLVVCVMSSKHVEAEHVAQTYWSWIFCTILLALDILYGPLCILCTWLTCYMLNVHISPYFFIILLTLVRLYGPLCILCTWSICYMFNVHISPFCTYCTLHVPIHPLIYISCKDYLLLDLFFAHSIFSCI